MELQQKYGERGLQVVLVAREPAEEIKAIPTLRTAPVTILADAGAVFDSYGVNAIPHTLFYDRSGETAARFEGYDVKALEGVEQKLR